VSSKCPASEQEQPLLGDAILGHPDHHLSVLTEGLGWPHRRCGTVTSFSALISLFRKSSENEGLENPTRAQLDFLKIGTH